MKTLNFYVKGFLIGMIAEYCYRVQIGYFQIVMLVLLLLEMYIFVRADFKKMRRKRPVKRKLIEMYQEYLIVCDNKSCGFKIKNESGDPNEDVSMYINNPCPDCGDNLLTEKDYRDSIKFLKKINWINKWFSWLTFLNPKKSKNTETTRIHIHNGINIKD